MIDYSGASIHSIYYGSYGKHKIDYQYYYPTMNLIDISALERLGINSGVRSLLEDELPLGIQCPYYDDRTFCYYYYINKFHVLTFLDKSHDFRDGAYSVFLHNDNRLSNKIPISTGVPDKCKQLILVFERNFPDVFLRVTNKYSLVFNHG